MESCLQERTVVVQQRPMQPDHDGTSHLIFSEPCFHALLQRLLDIDWQPNHRHTALTQRLRFVVHRLRAQLCGPQLSSILSKFRAVIHNHLLTTESLSPFDRCRDAKVWRAVDGADELKVANVLSFDVAAERTLGIDGVRYNVEVLEAPGCGQRGANEMLVADGDVEDCATTGNVEPPVQLSVPLRQAWMYSRNSLVAIACQKIRVQCLHVKLNVPNSMRCVDQAQNAQVFASLRQALEWDADTWHAYHGVENGNFDFATGVLYLLNLRLEGLHEVVIFYGVGILDLDSFCRCSLCDVFHSEIATLVDSSKVYDVIAFFERQVSKHCVDSCSCIGYENDGLRWRVYDFCDGSTGGIQMRRILPADEVVWTRFCSILKRAKDVADRSWVSAERTWWER